MVSRWSVLTVVVPLFLLISLAFTLAADPTDGPAVNAFVQTWVDMNNKQDINGLLALFAPEARIESRSAGGKVSLGMYAGSLKQLQARAGWATNQEAKVISLSFPAPDRALLELETSWEYKGRRQMEKQQWLLTRRDGRWLILEKNYLK